MNTLGLYIHVPFCKSKCRYCDFCSFPHPKEDRIDAYLDALCREIESYGQEGHPYFEAVRTREVDTVYFGGGTPTLLSTDRLSRVMSTLKCVFSIADDAEITVECNPATADLAYFQALRAMGFNRLSIGVQSMQDGELRLLGRLHTADDVRKTVADARKAGFRNVSLDLMLGIPAQTKEGLADTLSAILALAPEHVSAYGLQIEEGTYFARHRDELPFPDEDTESAMYRMTASLLAANGISQYEISNFAHPGFESRHNLRYWRRLDYLGFGLAAHSCMGADRFANTEDLDRYLTGAWQEDYGEISLHDILTETVMLGMRLAEGIDFLPLVKQYGKEAKAYADALSAYIDDGFVKADGTRLAFTAEGMYVSNTILSDVLDFEG